MSSYKSPKGAVEKLIDHIKKKGKDRSWSDLTRMFFPDSDNMDWARSVLRAKGYDVITGEFTVEGTIARTKAKAESNRYVKHSGELVKKIISLEEDLKSLAAIKEYPPTKFDIPAPKQKNKNEATAIIQWSDWHCDEIVEFESTNGMNEFNKSIAKQRVSKLAENTVKLLDSQRSAVDINNVILHLGGDAIGGYIHPELQQTNSMSPLQGIFYAKDLVVSALEYLMQHGNIKNLVVVTSRGNHGRTTPKMQYANDYAMNFETFLYWSLADYFKNEKRITFKIDQSELSYITVYDKILRFFHGHQIKFQGGIGGLTIPLYKAIHRWDSNIKAYYNFMCDKHTYSQPTPNCQVNGSLKGYDAFAVSHGFSFQPPLQSFTLLDSKRGITIKAPIFCE
jgi:hypothetical protein